MHKLPDNPSFPAAILYEVAPGFENSVKDTLKDKGHSHLYKAFGKFDLISLVEVSSFNESLLYESCHGVTAVKPIVGYPIHFPSHSDNIFKPSGKSLVAVQLLELDKWYYSKAASSENCSAAIAKFMELVHHTFDNKIEVQLFGGFGQSEIFLIVHSDDIDEIWEVVRFCRSLKARHCFSRTIDLESELPLFENTNTIIGLSYQKIAYEDANVVVDQNLDCAVECSIEIKCNAGFEKRAIQLFNSLDEKKVITYKNSAGLSDLVLKTSAPVEMSYLVEILLRFRNSWQQRKLPALITNTSLYFHEIDLAADSTDSSSYELKTRPSVEWDIPDELRQSNIRLVNRLIQLKHAFASFSQNRATFYPLKCAFDYSDYIGTILNTVEWKDLHERLEAENNLLQAVELLEMGISQRIKEGLNSSYADNEIPLPFGDGIFSSLIAIEEFIKCIFQMWEFASEEIEQADSFKHGFPIFHDSSGFKMVRGECFTLPLASLFDPASQEGNWLTLTHEISHAISFRLDFWEKEKKSLSSLRSDVYGDKDDPIADENYTDYAYEVFAHWFDFVHFFEEDMERFLRSVWRSWVKIPKVLKNIDNYLDRSFFIYCAPHLKKIDEAKLSNDKDSIKNFVELLGQLYDDHDAHLKSLEILDERILTLSKALREEIVHRFIFSCGLLSLFEKHRNYAFTKLLSQKTAKSDDQLEKIKEGIVLDERVENPFWLTREFLAREFETDKPNFHGAVALMMSVKNNNSLYEYKD